MVLKIVKIIVLGYVAYKMLAIKPVRKAVIGFALTRGADMVLSEFKRRK